jgi:hypothetical protein
MPVTASNRHLNNALLSSTSLLTTSPNPCKLTIVMRIEGLRLKETEAQGQVRFLFNITANYRMVFKAKLKRF